MPALSITLIHGPLGWLADFRYYAPYSDEVQRAFNGATVVPLPYTADASEEMVRADMAERYPLAHFAIDRRC